MPICIECRYPVPQLYHVLQGPSSKNTASGLKPPLKSTDSTANQVTPDEPTVPSPSTNINSGLRGGGEASQKTRIAGTDVRLTQCPRCKKFADKYVEHDFVVLFIDLVLVKPQVYRHLLINRLDVSLSSTKTHFDPAILRLGLLLTLFDVYLTWSRIELLPEEQTASSPIPSWPVAAQYLFFMVLSLGGTLAQHMTIRALAWLPIFQSPESANLASSVRADASTTQGVNQQENAASQSYSISQARQWFLTLIAPPASSSGIAISTALIVSSCMKLFPILMVVWKYDDASVQLAWGIKLAVAVQNLEALRVVLGLIYWQAGLLVLAGRVAEDAIAQLVLHFGGLGNTSVGLGLDIGNLFSGINTA